MPLDTLSNKLLSEREDLAARAAVVKRNAEEQGRDLNEADTTALQSYRERISQLDDQLKITTQDFTLDTEVADRIARISGAPVVKRGANPWEGMHAGQVLADFLLVRSSPAAEARVTSWRQHHERAAEHMGTDKSLTVPTAGGFGGLLIKPMVGPVINLTPTESPLLALVGSQESPNAMSFQRPRLLDPSFTTAAGKQSQEKAELTSKAFDITADTVSLKTYGNYLNLSLQAEQFITGSLDTVISQLTARTVYALETAVGAELATATVKVTLAADGDAAAVLAAWQEAAGLVYSATKRPPTWAVAGIEGWSRLSGLSDLAGRPLFPAMGNSVNVLGTTGGPSSMTLNVNGIPLAVSLGITDGTIYMGNSFGLEVYLHRYPVLQAVEPSLIGRQIAVAASAGFYQPPTTEAGPGNVPPAVMGGIVKIAP
jgi:HK97 family phage major capsid protein